MIPLKDWCILWDIRRTVHVASSSDFGDWIVAEAQGVEASTWSIEDTGHQTKLYCYFLCVMTAQRMSDEYYAPSGIVTQRQSYGFFIQ